MAGHLRSRRSLCIALLAAIVAFTGVAQHDAEARRNRRKPAKANINVRALGELMGPFKFGMTKDQVLKVLGKDIRERYKEKISATTDVYAQDKLRRERKAEVKKIKDSYVEFTGKKSGWDVSIIDDQFAQRTGESMMVHWESDPSTGKNQRRFFFFHEGRLYKMFISLSGSMLGEGKNFAYFQNLMEKRYGDAKVQYDTDSQGVEYPAKLDWSTSKFHVQAIDKLSFYNSFVLVISDPDTEALVADARAARRKPAKDNAIIDAVLEGEDAPPPSLDSRKHAVDRVLK